MVGCATLREAAALRRVEFRLDRVSDAEVVRIRLDPLPTYRSLTAAQIARLGVGVATRDVPFGFTLHLEGRNPQSNQVAARMIALGWSYRVDDREILNGRLDQPLRFPPGQAVDVPVAIEFNLYRFFGGDARTLFETAAALAGQAGGRHDVEVRLTPRIDTPIGPMDYPTPITIRLASADAG
ncbi:MAG TPA: hypothetical protein VE326_07090 [Candidatus Binatia bacterium]|nr:hypothetical protein [Candidatus Binatia bacterium]